MELLTTQPTIASELTEMAGELTAQDERQKKTLALNQAMVQELHTGGLNRDE